MLIPEKLLEVKASPFIEVSLRRNDRYIVIHLVNWHVGRTSIMPLIAEHLLPVNNVSIKLKLKMQPKAVKIVPEDEGTLEWHYEDSYLYAKVNGIKIHSMIIIEI